MAKLVLTASRVSTYDDVIEEWYHFPTRPYLATIQRGVGDQVLYYEPRRGGGRQVYFAKARIAEVVPDPDRDDHAYAVITDYQDFPSPIPWRTLSGTSFEPGLAKADGMPNKGRFGRAVRQIPEDAFYEVVALGMTPTLGFEPGQPDPLDDSGPPPEPVPVAADREVVWTQREVRDRAFRAAVQQAYDNTCAVTGLQLVNGGGAAEIEAAHIRAVADRGPDAIRNGLALSRTIHWMFDRFLFTLDDDLRIVAGPKGKVDLPPHLIQAGHPLRQLPARHSERPHPVFLRWHQERFEKKWAG